MKKNSILILIIALSFSQVTFSQKLFGKLISKAAGAQTSNAPVVSKLSEVTPSIGFTSNIHPVDLGTISQSFFEGWKTGGDIVFILLNNNSSLPSSKVDGSVTIDGKPAEFSTGGFYYIVADPSDAPKKVELTTSSGEKSSFTIEPNKKHFKILSINGLTDEIVLDLTKDVVIELDDSKIPDNTLLRVSIAINQIGIKSTYDVCYIKKGSKITVPAAAFRNINISREGKFKKSFLSVGIDENVAATSITGSYPTVYYTSSYEDGKFIAVKPAPEINLGLEVKGKEGEMEYDIKKPNAFSSRPFSQIKKLGITSFSMKGITFVENSVIVQEEDLAKGTSQTTKITTIEFPKQSDEFWNAVLTKMAPEITKTLQGTLNASVMPIDEMYKNSSFKKLSTFEKNSNTDKEFVKGIGNSEQLNLSTFIETSSVNCLQEQIMKETGTDGLCKFTLELIISENKEKAYVTPKLTYEITGKINGVKTTTSFVSGTVTGNPVETDLVGLSVEYSSPGTGKPFKKNKVEVISSPAASISAEQLEQLIRTSGILSTFESSLKLMLDAEKLNGDYEIVWNLQN